jgi:RecA-family ATPase
MRSVTIATLFHYADQADPAWRQRYNDEERQRDFARMAAGAGSSSGAGTSGAGAGTGSTSSGTPGTGQTPPPLIQAKPFALRDPKTLPRRQWVYGRHLIRKFGSATFAPSGSGKTNTFIVEALAIATGRDLLGITPPKRARVWLWNGEDPYDELERRVGAACLHYKITPEEINGWLFINSGRDSDSRIVIATQSRNGVTIAVPMVEALIQTIRDNKIDVVMIDPFISSHNVTENDNNAIDTVAKTWTGIADVTNIALDLGHHTRKTGGAEVSVEDGRGAVALLNAVRPARVLNVMTEDEAAKAGVTDGRKRYFRVTDGKNNLALPADKMEWFRSTTINLGNGDDPGNLLDRGDDIGVITKWEWPDPSME